MPVAVARHGAAAAAPNDWMPLRTLPVGLGAFLKNCVTFSVAQCQGSAEMVLTGGAKVDVVGVAVCLAKRPVNGGWSAANRAKTSPALATTSPARRNDLATKRMVKNEVEDERFRNDWRSDCLVLPAGACWKKT